MPTPEKRSSMDAEGCQSLAFCDLRGGTAADRPEESSVEHEPASASVACGHGIYLVPSFVQNEECDALMSAAREYVCRVGPPLSGFKLRLPISKLPESYNLCDRIVRRTLRLMEDRLPSLAKTLFGQAVGLSDMDIHFSLNEPAVNVYQAGGSFEEHEDGHMLTVLVPLSEAESYEGGGTKFWPTSADAEPFCVRVHDRSLLDVRHTEAEQGRIMLPPRGTALLFVGSVTHAGVCVRSGERIIWVASFNLRPWQEGHTGAAAHRLLVSNTRVIAKETLEEAHDAADRQEEQLRNVYGGLRSDLRHDLAVAAAAAAASDVQGMCETIGALPWGGDHEAIPASTFRIQVLSDLTASSESNAAGKGSAPPPGVREISAPAPVEPVMLSRNGCEAAKVVAAEMAAGKPSMSALPVTASQRGPNAGLFTHQ
jgi:hypothetical protein